MSSSPTKSSALDSPLRRALEQPPLKRFRMASKTAEAGSLTEPESLGPCEPGTSINLDGIVWNETKGGMLSLNITWRGRSYMGTLIDCSVTDHGSEWAAPWSADTEAPDQKTRVIRKKKNKKKKKRKKPLHNGTDQSLANISNESIEDKTESTEEGKPISLISCSSDHCEKKFTSESALKYHVTFAHEKIMRPAPSVIPAKSVSRDRNVSNNGVMAPHEASDDSGSKQDTNGSTEDISLAQSAGEQRREGNNSSNTGSKDKEKMRTKAFPSTQNIRPILPAQGPQIPGTQLKPIQPKPAILPPPHKSLNLDTLKKPLLNKSPVNNSSSVKCEPGLATSDNGPGAAMDLSHGGQTPHTERAALLPELKREVKPEPALVTPPKARTPIISIKSEFNTGIVNKSLSDPTDRDELEVLKHISKAPGAAPFPAHSEYLSHPAAAALGLMSSPLGPGLGLPGYLGLHGPPSSTASHLLPGLMGLPGVAPPGHPAASHSPLSPFGASLESLARAAEERARSFGGGFSPAALPGVPGALHSPGAALPGGAPGLGRPGPPGAAPPVPGVPGAPPTSESGAGGDAPLLRHEHMHTHLHYITSPTHASQ